MEERKTRRNKRIMIVAAIFVLLAAILCLGGVTFAKYVSKGGGKAQATVAKWGCVVTADVDNLFFDAYNNDNTKATWATPTGNGIKISADTQNNKLVAPGAKGSMTITVGGKAEVASFMTFTEGTLNDISLKYDAYTPEGEGAAAVPAGTYNPIKWTLKKGSAEVAGATKTTLAACLTALKTDLGFTGAATQSAVKAPGEAWGNADGTVKTFTLTWEWAFDNTATLSKADVFDTALAAYIAETDSEKKADILTNAGCVADGLSTTLSVDFSITIEQSQTGATA